MHTSSTGYSRMHTLVGILPSSRVCIVRASYYCARKAGLAPPSSSALSVTGLELSLPLTGLKRKKKARGSRVRERDRILPRDDTRLAS